MQTISKHKWVWNTTTSPYADHMCNPTIHVWSTSASSCRQARNKNKKWCETHHHPTQSRSQAGSKHRCESHRHHPGQGHKSRRGPQHGQCQTEQCSHAKYPQPGRPPTDQYKNKTHAVLVHEKCRALHQLLYKPQNIHIRKKIIVSHPGNLVLKERHGEVKPP